MAKGPQLLLRAGSRAARGSITRGGTPNRRNEWVNCYSVYTILIENDARCTRQKIKSRIVMAKADSSPEIGFKSKKEISKVLHLKHIFVWC